MSKFIAASLAVAAIGFVAISGGSAFAARLDQGNLPPLSLTENLLNANEVSALQGQIASSGITEQSLSAFDAQSSTDSFEAVRSHPNEAHHSGNGTVSGPV